MKNKVKRVVAVLLASSMILGMGIVAYAAWHECAFSYMGSTVTSPSTTVGSHTYTSYNTATGQMDTLTCYISAETRSDVYKCACGKMEYRNPVTRTHHSSCGL